MNKQETDIGTCPAHWEVVKFSSVAELKHGYQFRTNDFTDTGVKVFKITQIKSDGSIDLTSCSFIDASRLESFKNNIINYGDILMALSGATIGKIGRFKSDEVVLQNYRVGNFIPHDEEIILKDYFYYFLTTENTYFQIMANQNQSAQENVGKADIHNMLVFLPPFEEQKSIAEVLSSLDDKIDLLHRQNQTLEQMAETLFRQRFVEEVDEGWRSFGLLEVVKLVPGGTPKTSIKEYWDGDIKWISVKEISENYKSFIFNSYKTITEDGLNNSAANLFPKYGTIISARGTVGKIALLGEQMAFSQSNFGVLHISGRLHFFTFLLLQHIVEELKASAYGSVFDTITTRSFQDINVTLPDDDIIESFESEISPLFKKMFNNQNHIRTLTSLRDTLLPKLMSGEIKVNNN